MKRYDIINYLIKKHELESYLEIGVFQGECFNNVRCAVKESVDPKFPATHQMTSDKFFNNVKSKMHAIDELMQYDIVFVDGMHTAEQTYQDIHNAWYITGAYFVVVHDVNPATEWHTRPPEQYNRGEEWNGTSYLGFLKFKCEHPQLSIFTIDTDYGVGIITREKIGPTWEMDFEYFDRNRKELLNLVDKDYLFSS